MKTNLKTLLGGAALAVLFALPASASNLFEDGPLERSKTSRVKSGQSLKAEPAQKSAKKFTLLGPDEMEAEQAKKTPAAAKKAAPQEDVVEDEVVEEEPTPVRKKKTDAKPAKAVVSSLFDESAPVSDQSKATKSAKTRRQVEEPAASEEPVPVGRVKSHAKPALASSLFDEPALVADKPKATKSAKVRQPVEESVASEEPAAAPAKWTTKRVAADPKGYIEYAVGKLTAANAKTKAAVAARDEALAQIEALTSQRDAAERELLALKARLSKQEKIVEEVVDEEGASLTSDEENAAKKKPTKTAVKTAVKGKTAVKAEPVVDDEDSPSATEGDLSAKDD